MSSMPKQQNHLDLNRDNRDIVMFVDGVIPDIEGMQELLKQQAYKDPFQRLKPSIKPLYNANGTSKFSKKKDESPKKKKKFNTRISPRSSIQQVKKVKQRSTSPRFMNQNLNSSKFAPTDVMSEDLPPDEEDGDEMYTIHQQSNSRLENVYTTSDRGQNQDQ